ncbi:MAG TPA: GNAT family N-acetyltransferase [Burkholderiales bacterium]|nr:GNAT family N-acetyltransferase [Burkholderiales bacterium]
MPCAVSRPTSKPGRPRIRVIDAMNQYSLSHMGSRLLASRAWDTRRMDDILHERTGQRGAFVIRREGRMLAQMSYSLGGRMAIIDHTDVDGALRGTGTGARLVKAAVEWARAEKLAIVALCPFAKSVFDKTPEYADVLKK